MEIILLTLCTYALGISAVTIPNGESCALKACKTVDSKKINVHLISHSHDDVGWLKTQEEYFYGLRDDIRNAGVEYTLDSTVQALQQNEDRRYIQVETAYFWKWWQKQNPDKRTTFSNMVNSGQIEIIGGGWSMNDEACVNYQSTINQLTWGLRLLNDTLGECGRPRIGWQIDPFGHSREQASIFKQMGYQAFFFTRLSEDDRKARKLTKDLEFMWKSNDNFNDSEIFTSIMDGYYAPSDFCWDYTQCNSDALNDDPDSFDYNIDLKVQEFSEHISNYSSYFKTNNILYAMGGDFQYQAAEINFLNIDKLIKAFSNNEKYNVFYSTPSCYLKAVLDSKPNLTEESGDFFPYNENSNVYWSGYFTSRSTLKRYERITNNILQAAQQINAFGKLINNTSQSNYEENVRKLREAVGTMQHHDAITGTERERVANDYSRIMTDAIRDVEKTIGHTIGNLLKYDNVSDYKIPLSTCLLTNISVCDNTLQNKSLIVVYNPLSKSVKHHLRVPVQNGTYKLISASGDVPFEIVKHMKYPVEYPFNNSIWELVSTDSIPPMGIKVYYLKKINNTSSGIEQQELNPNVGVTIENKNIKITFNQTYRNYTITWKKQMLELRPEFLYYNSNNGSGDNRTSGAYVFRPQNGTDAIKIDDTNIRVLYTNGTIVKEIITYLGNYIASTIRLYEDDDEDYIEHDWIVGPLSNNTVDTKNNIGKEIIVRYTLTNFTNDVFYTDSNGRQMMERKRTNLPFNNDSVEPVASNYYPVTSRITIVDKSLNSSLSVLTDRSQGGTSLNNGQIELMLHRRTLKDDHKGLDETLEEKEYGQYIVTRGSHYLTLGTPSSYATERILALNKLNQPWVLTADATSEELNYETLVKKIKFEWTGLNKSINLPANVQILTFSPWIEDSYILRLEHIFENDDGDSTPVNLELKNLFYPSVISSINELSLGGNIWVESQILGDNYNITLGPMEIRTFSVQFKKK